MVKLLTWDDYSYWENILDIWVFVSTNDYINWTTTYYNTQSYDYMTGYLYLLMTISTGQIYDYMTGYLYLLMTISTGQIYDYMTGYLYLITTISTGQIYVSEDSNKI